MVRERWQKVGEVSVDSASLRLADPCYPDDPRPISEICPDVHAGNGFCVTRDGVTFYTYHGDGTYPVYAEFEEGRAVRVMVDLDPEDDE